MLSARAANQQTLRTAGFTRAVGQAVGHVLDHLLSATPQRITVSTRHEDVACNT